MRVADLLDLPGLGLRLLAGAQLDRPVRGVYTTDLTDPGRYLSGGELVLTGLLWCHAPGDAGRFAGVLAEAGAAAIGAGEALGTVPPELVTACAQLGLPLLAVPAETSFGTVTAEVLGRLSGDQADAATRALGRQRRMLSAVTGGAGPGELLRMAAGDIATACWLITGTGRPLASAAGPAGLDPGAPGAGATEDAAGPGLNLAQPLARLAREYLTSTRFPAVVRAAGQDYTLFPAGGPPSLTGWFLACAAGQGWAAEHRESAAELAADLALDRAKLDGERRAESRLGQQIMTSLASGASPDEAGVLLRAAGFPLGGRYLAVAVAATGWGETGPALPELIEELLAPVGGCSVIGRHEDVILALVLLTDDGPEAAPDDPADQDRRVAPRAASQVADLIRAAGPLLTAGLRGGRLSVGISDAARGTGGLAGVIREARSARRLAELRTGTVRLATGDEAGTHAMLLASVPADVLASFRARLLGPLERYDRRRQAQLVPTLREFLACDGSWSACAQRLHVHVNTLRYRIRRIEELTGRELSSLDAKADFLLALGTQS
ncbi:MAG TPA: PucR family transcriptional regulator ligand-binding domain-containing protein [Streptosporangiaceae bacterium]